MFDAGELWPWREKLPLPVLPVSGRCGDCPGDWPAISRARCSCGQINRSRHVSWNQAWSP